MGQAQEAVMSRLLPLLLSLALAACTPGTSPSWVSQVDGGTPGMSDTSDCRAEARRQAELRYPPRPLPRPPGGGPEPFYRQEDSDRFPAENRFFEMCMHRKGFRRV